MSYRLSTILHTLLHPRKTLVRIRSLEDHIAVINNERAKCLSEQLSMLKAWHGLISPSEPFYSWQRDWQDCARLLLGLPRDCTMDDIRIALAFREAPE